MKKSQLRNIIRESIKELMNEQERGNFSSSPFLPSKSDLKRAVGTINKQDTLIEPNDISNPLKEQSACDNTPQGTCAQQWMSSNLANAFLPTNHICTGPNSFEGLHNWNNNWATSNLNYNVWISVWMQLYTFTTGPMSYGEISSFVNTYAIQAGISNSLRAKIKRKWAKSAWGRCMGATWAYGGSVNWSGGNCNC